MSSVYGNRDPREAPAYAISFAAKLVGVPTTTLRAWVSGRSYETLRGRRKAAPIIALPEPGYLSFVNLVEAHVLSALRREYQLKLDNIRRAIAYLRRDTGDRHPLARESLRTNRVDVFVERLGDIVNASRGGQLAVRTAIEGQLERVEYDRGLAVRLFPIVRRDDPKSRPVVIDPLRAFGRPVLNGTGVPVSMIQERFHGGGESIEHIARDYGVTKELIEDALRATA